MVNPEKPAPRKRRKAAPSAGNAAPASPSGAAPAGTPDDARRNRIAEIKKALEDGTYHVSNEDVARKVIEHMMEPKK